jgi:hypothetical protein
MHEHVLLTIIRRSVIGIYRALFQFIEKGHAEFIKISKLCYGRTYPIESGCINIQK